MDLIFNARRYCYKSSLDKEAIVNEIKKMIAENSREMSGKIKENYEFKINSKWQIGALIRNFETSPAYLIGKIVEEDKQNKIYVAIRPNFIFAILGYALPLAGLLEFYFCTILCVTAKYLPFVIIGVLFFFLGNYLRNNLKKSFEKKLGMFKENTP